MVLTYQAEAEEIFPSESSDGAIAARLLSFELPLENFGYKSLLFVCEWHASSVVERSLRHVVEQTKQKLLRITLLTNHEVAVPTNLVKQFNSDRPHAQDVLLTQFQNAFDVRFQHTEGAELFWRLQSVENHWHERDRVHVTFVR